MKYAAGGVKGKSGQPLSVELPVPAPGALDITVKDGSGQTVAALAWQVTLPDGTVKSGNTQGDGRITVGGATGDCKVVFPALDKDAPKTAGGDEPAPQAQAQPEQAQPDQPQQQAQPEQKPAPTTPQEKRQAIIAKAREYLGTVNESAGPDGKKFGWEKMKEFYDTSYGFDSFQDQNFKTKILAPHDQPNSWCGIFALAMSKKSGVVGSDVVWKFGGGSWGIKGLPFHPASEADQIQPGDIIIVNPPNPKGEKVHHHAIVIDVNAGQYHTIDGNSYDGKYGHTVCEHPDRNRSDLEGWYKTVPDE